MKLKIVCYITISVILTIFPSLLLSKTEEGGFSYKGNTFFGYGKHLILSSGVTLPMNDNVTVFSGGKPHITAHVIDIIEARPIKMKFNELGFSKIYSDKELWSDIGFYWGLRGAHAENFAELSLPEHHNIDIAIKNLPESAFIISKTKKQTSRRELQKNWNKLKHRLPPSYLEADLIFDGKSYKNNGSHIIEEFFVGIPTYHEKKQGISKIKLTRFILYNGIVIEQDEFSRSSDISERVDTAPPNLKGSNWFKLSDVTIGYISLNNGISWQILIKNGGFEGIVYKIRTLGVNKNDDYRSYLYTPH